MNIPISELELSHLVLNLGFLQAPPKVKGRTVKIHQIKVIKKELMPPIFLLYVNDTTLMPESYERFVLNKIRVGFDIKYIPIYMKLKNYKR
ncbi:hypothetical protein ASO20_00580 [Mycoplasma sp. (ex Biomphalaria glabrata)]|uniref:hypothetical protein n=1 Tax=Mycoplasma sp. (ex Biomphalaria glabrata) TaxID=1749074 RepID=UPI00073A8B2E|nr:hypothetical protein [Mycoplasma sp. (ex Biomphalaria glabrata)]ALV23172.1 hypothetical protein ASO20_00580 [Mycoplasma sp. (ex Biomphalaria glabrata)]